MKYSDLSSKNRLRSNWLKFASASLLAVAIAGCGGGSDSPVAVTPPVVVPPVVVAPVDAPPVGAAVLTAAAASPATTNTAANPAQAFGLIYTAGANSVTVQSPPVVHFTVIGSDGKFVPGLTLVNPAGSVAGLAADANCSGNNVTFAMAKFDGSNWQSLISRQRYLADDMTPRYSSADAVKKQYPPTFRYAVVEGTTDPKPTATTAVPAYINPATAVTDPSTRIVGILEENAAGGYYTYRFATDVTTPLLMVDAVDKKNVSVGKVANNGNVAVKDGQTIHRIGAQLCYTDPATKAKVVVNPYVDFTLDAKGVAVPVKATDGTLAAAKKVVDKASCNECHSTLVAHGTRVDPNYCVICHNPGSTDYNTNNLIDLKVMIHKFHLGKGAVTGTSPSAKLTKDYRVTNNLAGNAKTTLSTGEVTGFVFPQPSQNCTKCHDGSATATNKTAQGDNWKSMPSRAACGSCHDGINFANNTGVTLADYKAGKTTSLYGHVGGAKQDDTQCIVCHDAATIPIDHKDTLPTTADATKRTMSATINAVTVGAVDGSVTVNFSVKDADVAVTDITKFTKPSFGLIKLVPAAKGESSHWVSYTGRFRTKTATVAPVLQGSNENSGTLSSNADGTFNYKFALPNGSTPGDINTITHAHVSSSVGPAAATVVGGWTWDGAAWTETGTGAATGTGLNPVAYEPTLTHRVAMTFQKAGTPNVDNATNAYFDFVPAGGAVTSTRNIVTMANCATCHAGARLHSGYATEYCVQCHNQSTFDPFTGETVDLQRLIHKIHMGKDLPSVKAGGTYVVNGAHDYSKAGYPGVIKDCAVCHNETATGPDGKKLANAANWYTMPTKRACATCHDSVTATEHIDAQITAAGEQCVKCHAPNSIYGLDVKSVHK